MVELYINTPFRSDRPLQKPMAHPVKQKWKGHVSNRRPEVIVFEILLIGPMPPSPDYVSSMLELHPEMAL